MSRLSSHLTTRGNFVEIVVPLGLEGTLTYAIPPHYHGKVVVGSRVVVPFKKKCQIGLILTIHNHSPSYPVKSIIEIPDNVPFYAPTQAKLFQWMHDYYLAPLGSVMRTMFESQKHFFIPELKTKESAKWSPNELPLLRQDQSSWNDILTHLNEENNFSLITQLVKEKKITLAPPLPEIAIPSQKVSSKRRKKKNHLFNDQLALAKQLHIVIQELKKGKNIYLRGGSQLQQQQIYQAVAAHIIQQGGQVLYLCCNKKTVKVTLKQLKKKWKKSVQGYYNGILPSSKQKIAVGVKKGDIAAVVGRLGALFLPFRNLQLIMISEAEDTAYKQIGVAPRYHGRDTALMLAHYTGIPTLQGDIVPSLESYQNIKKGKYHEVVLPNLGSAKVDLVGLTFEQKLHKSKGVIARAIWEHIGNALASSRPLVVIHSRKGYAHYHRCSSCEWIARCSHCNISLTYHQATGHLECHYCSKKAVPFQSCPACGTTSIKQHGMGIQQVEELLRRQYSTKKVAQIDQGSTPDQKQLAMIKQWEEKKIDILVATPGIIKDLPTSDHGLAIFLDLDQRLKQANWRVQEELLYDIANIAAKGYDLLVQTASEELRKIAYQTTEKNKVPFYEAMLADRKIAQYPPCRKLVCLMIVERNRSVAKKVSKELAIWLKKNCDHPILGPQPTTPVVGEKYPPIALWALLPLTQLAKSKKTLHYLVEKWKKKQPTTIRVIWNVDPVSK